MMGLSVALDEELALAPDHSGDGDVAEAGGWRDPNTLLKCYQQPDEATMTRVVLEPGKLRDA